MFSLPTKKCAWVSLDVFLQAENSTNCWSARSNLALLNWQKSGERHRNSASHRSQGITDPQLQKKTVKWCKMDQFQATRRSMRMQKCSRECTTCEETAQIGAIWTAKTTSWGCRHDCGLRACCRLRLTGRFGCDKASSRRSICSKPPFVLRVLEGPRKALWDPAVDVVRCLNQRLSILNIPQRNLYAIFWCIDLWSLSLKIKANWIESPKRIQCVKTVWKW
jgi:hypothetical protein